MAAQARWPTWLLVVTLAMVAYQCGFASCADVAGWGDSAAALDLLQEREGAPTGDFPTQELKEKSRDVERQYLAKQKVIADFKEEKWRKKVMKVKVSKYADYLEEIKAKQLSVETEKNAKITAVRKKENDAKNTVTANRQRADDLDAKMAYGDERQKKANAALKSAIKQVGALKNGQGMHADADRSIASAMLAKLRVAQAHNDNSIVGLTADQKKSQKISLLHSSIELAVGSPTDTNLALAVRQIKETTADSTKQSYEEIEKMHTKYEVDQKAFQKKLEDAEKMQKHSKEHTSKKTAEKDGKRNDKMSEGLELPAKRLKEKYNKKDNEERRYKWTSHEDRVTAEYAQKGTLKTESYKIQESDFKKTKAAEEKVLKEECAVLEKKKMGIMEGRNKAVAAFNTAREKLITSQNGLNNVKPYDPSTEKPMYVNAGDGCVVMNEWIVAPGQAAASKDQCEQLCNDKGAHCGGFNYPHNNQCDLLKPGGVGKHPECVMQSNGKCVQNPPQPQGCTVWQKISGPGSQGDTLRVDRSLSSRRLLFGGATKIFSNPAPPQTPPPTPDPQEAEQKAQGRARAENVERAQKEHAKASAEQEKQDQADQEKQTKVNKQNALAQEASTKNAAIAENLANEKQKKTDTAEAERHAHNAEAKMQEANSKAANADTQSRHCEGEMYRRRRTCACDDQAGVGQVLAAGGRRLLSEDLDYGKSNGVAATITPDAAEIAAKKLSNWERRRYVRRRYVAPTAADRRRRAEFPAPPPPARLPGAVCPCCSPAPDGTPDPKPACAAARKAAAENSKTFAPGGR